jgi:hypothetical protein
MRMLARQGSNVGFKESFHELLLIRLRDWLGDVVFDQCGIGASAGAQRVGMVCDIILLGSAGNSDIGTHLQQEKLKCGNLISF